MRSRGLATPQGQALACMIGARRAWTVEMISSVSIPCSRYRSLRDGHGRAGAGSASPGAHHAGAQPHARGAVNPPGSSGPADQRIRHAAPPIRTSLAAAARRNAPRPKRRKHQDRGQQARTAHPRPIATLPKVRPRATHDRGRACDRRCADRLRRADLDRARSGRTAPHRHRADPQTCATPARPLNPDRYRDIGRSGLVSGPFAVEERRCAASTGGHHSTHRPVRRAGRRRKRCGSRTDREATASGRS